MADGKSREVLFEIVTLGDYAKITAIDPVTGTEVSLSGPANADPAALKAVAMRKLDYVLKRKSGD